MSSQTKIALVGRANVGKSTLFNCFSKSKTAMVYNQPGVTRDVRCESIDWAGYLFNLCDTPGVDLYDDLSLKKQVLERIQETLQESDYIWFLVDGTASVTHFDRDITKMIRKLGKPIIVLVNKADRKDCDETAFHTLGFKNIVPISAEHQLGLHDIFELMDEVAFLKKEEPSKRSKITVLGRPNAGKSTLINTLLGKNYQLTGEQPGLTRESIGYAFNFEGKAYELIDTAGLRKKSKMMTEELERLSWKASFESLKFTECVLYLIDSQCLSEFSIDQQDFLMINKILEEGRCLVIGLSKWETVKTQKESLETFKQILKVKGFGFVPVIPLSSFKKIGLTTVFSKIQRCIEQWNERINTGKLNTWLQEMIALQAPPSIKGRFVKPKFITQIKTRPPRLCIFVNVEDSTLETYKRFLTNRFYTTFGYEGVPIRIFFRTSKNPYAQTKENKI